MIGPVRSDVLRVATARHPAVGIPSLPGTFDPFVGDSEMAARMREVAWECTELGAVAQWSHALRTAVSLCLLSRLSSCIYWGGNHLVLYNDAFSSIIQAKHPWALLQPAVVVLPEIFDIIGPLMRTTLHTGRTTGADDAPVFINRQGYIEEFYCSFSYTPLLNEHGAVEGVFATVPETSGRIIGERRLQTLQRLGLSTRQARRMEDTLGVAADVLAENPYDVPFASLYLYDDEGEQARLTAVSNMPRGTPLSPDVITADAPSPLAGYVSGEPPPVVRFLDIDDALQPVPTGAWRIPPHQLAVLSLTATGARAPRVIIFAAVSPHKRLDAAYIQFFEMLADQIARAIGEAFAHQQEHDRVKALQARARIVQQEERVRIARDLHDTLLQSVQGMKFLLEAGLAKLRADDATASGLFTRALAASTQAVAEGREVLSLLRSSSITYDLPAALASLRVELARASDAKCAVVISVNGVERAIVPTAAAEIQAICREAGLNAVRHASARTIELRATFDADLVIEVCDDGCGIDEHTIVAGRPGHFGLPGMRERAAAVFGELSVARRASGGTVVRLRLPGTSTYAD